MSLATSLRGHLVTLRFVLGDTPPRSEASVLHEQSILYDPPDAHGWTRGRDTSLEPGVLAST